jgi:hypothetical protein
MIIKNVFSLNTIYSVFLAAAAILFSSGCMVGVVHRERIPVVTAQQEYNIEELNDYGEWLNTPEYGNVWRPYVDPDWRPFFHGHWAYTDGEWTWISYEPFGWIVYHYGNWAYTNDLGWVWIPGYGEWSPARVQWLEYDDYVCWAPLPPGRVIWPQPWERSRLDVWVVVRDNDFMSDNIGTRRIDRSILWREPHRGTIFVRRPELNMIQQHTAVPIRPIRIEREKAVVGKREFNRMRIPEPEKQRVDKYRPKVEKEVVRRSGVRRERR